MSETSAIRLVTLFSPAFPIGSFAWSQGLERAVSDGLVCNSASLGAWLATLLDHGSGWNDAVVFAAAWRDETGATRLALAMAGSGERFSESARQADALRAAAAEWIGAEGEGEAAYAPALGRIAAIAGIPLETAIAAFLAAWVSNMIQVAIRLSVLGQSAGLRVLGALEPLLAETARRAANSTLEDLGGFAMMAEITSMNHETLQPRLFLS